MNTIVKNSLHLHTFPVGSYACNCSILYSNKTKEALIIDPGNDHELVLSKIKELGINVKKLLHTHAHFDHIGRSNEIAKETNSSIHLHKGDYFLYERLVEQGRYFGQSIGAPKKLEEHFDIPLEDGQTFEFSDTEINTFLETLHTPGHTPGSCCFYSNYFDTPQLFSGDTLFMQSIGRTDLPGGDGKLIIKSIKERLLNLPSETKIIAGHGPSTFIHYEKRNNPFLC